jgi:hypothetical protein
VFSVFFTGWTIMLGMIVEAAMVDCAYVDGA